MAKAKKIEVPSQIPSEVYVHESCENELIIQSGQSGTIYETPGAPGAGMVVRVVQIDGEDLICFVCGQLIIEVVNGLK